MAESDDLSPEKKLLKLIEGQDTETEEKETSAPAKASRGPAIDLGAVLSLGAIKGRLSFLRDAVQAFFKGQGNVHLNFKQVNQYLKIAAVSLFIVLVIFLLIEAGTVNQDYDSKFAVSPQSRAEVPLSRMYQFSNELFEEAAKENVFVVADKRNIDQKEEITGPSFKLIEMTDNLRLTGISVNPRESNKTFAMIEDLEKNMTNFLKVGDSIAGMTVHEISDEEGVILRRGSEEIVIR